MADAAWVEWRCSFFWFSLVLLPSLVTASFSALMVHYKHLRNWKSMLFIGILCNNPGNSAWAPWELNQRSRSTKATLSWPPGAGTGGRGWRSLVVLVPPLALGSLRGRQGSEWSTCMSVIIHSPSHPLSPVSGMADTVLRNRPSPALAQLLVLWNSFLCIGSSRGC